jgi:hypothetical protein
MRVKYEKPQLVSLTSNGGSAAGETRDCTGGTSPSATACSPTGAGDGVISCSGPGIQAAPGVCQPIGATAGDCVEGGSA